MMRVLQINSIYKSGSTGRTTYEVEQALMKEGYEAYVAYGYGRKDTSQFHLRINNKFTNTIHKILSRVTGLEGYFSIIPTIILVNKIKRIAPDIIHLRCLHGSYLNLPILFRFLHKYPGQVVINLHDCWDLTGHCPYFGECFKWRTECNHCEKLGSYPRSLFFDTSRKIFRDKKKWYAGIKNLTIIAVSKWLMSIAEESIFNGRRIKYIYNWVNQSIFHPYVNQEKKNKKEFTVVFVSASWVENSYRYNALMKLIEMLPPDIRVLIVGIYTGSTVKKENVEFLGYIGNPQELARIYSRSDVYVHLSIEEAFGKVIAEANACGIPGIVFNCTGCAEVVSAESGYKIDVGDFESILATIMEIKEKGKEHYSVACIENVNKRFNYECNSKDLIRTYESIMEHQ